MSGYDLVVRGGTVHDGIGGAPQVADIGIRDGIIVEIGKISSKGREELDAAGLIVTPGFIDVHTHYDGQALWENCLAPSSNHGVTSVVMGNCGVGFAPCRPTDRDMLVELMEGVEDIPEVVMSTGLAWNWQTFAEYLDALDARQLDVDVAAQLPHSALRVYVMGKRALQRQPATSDDLARMRQLTTEAMRVGALGVSTSRNMMHRTPAGELAPSLHSDEDELLALASGLRDAGTGVFQMIPDIVGSAKDEFGLMRRIAETSGRPLSFTLVQMATGDPEAWCTTLDLLTKAAADGLAIRAQVAPRPVGLLYGLDLSFHPFSLHPSFQPLLDLPLDAKVAAMRDPALKARLLAESPESTNPIYVQTVANARYAYVMGKEPCYDPDPNSRLDHRAAAQGLCFEEFVYDLLLEDEGRAILYQPGANYRDGNLEAVDAMISHPQTVLGLGDGGAHYGMICDSSFPTYFLRRWTRDLPTERRMQVSQVIKALTSDPAALVELNDRGRLAPGYRADLNLIDLDQLHLHVPTVNRNLPANGRRLWQRADGYVATIKAGTVTYRNGWPTGALPGRLVRGAQPKPLTT